MTAADDGGPRDHDRGGHDQDHDHDQDRSRGPLKQLISSFGGLLATAVNIGRTRIELLSVEVREELHRISGVLLWSAVAILATGAGLLFAAFAVILAYWDTHRILATVLVAAGFLVIAIIALLVIRARLRAYPQFLAATLAELRQDEEDLRGPPR